MKRGNIAIFVPHSGCPNACSFCNQRTISGTLKAPTPEEVGKICEEAFEKNTVDPENTQIAFFGGSFTAIDRDTMVSLLEAAYPYVKSKKVSGIRVSTRPDAIDAEILDILKKYGVDSIELGIQSMRDEVLLKNRRGHSSEDVRKSAAMIKSYGFEFGAQMMTGLYGDDDEGAVYTAKEIVKLNPDTVRIYPTVVLKGTELERLAERGEYEPKGVEESVKLCVKLIKIFRKENVRIIRVGLHASDNVEGEAVGGAYHPAFHELCEAEIMREKIADELLKYEKGKYDVFVNPKDVSKTVGQKRKNIVELKNIGYDITVKETEKLKIGEVEIKKGER